MPAQAAMRFEPRLHVGIEQTEHVALSRIHDVAVENTGETATTAQELLDSGVWNTLSFGPAIVATTGGGELMHVLQRPSSRTRASTAAPIEAAPAR